jgi:tetratricopeptide (TPR) repeat protein
MAGWDADGLRDAEARFEQAVRLDPEFGAAWAGIAETTVMRHEMHGVRERDEAYARATDAARRAIGARLPAAEGHAALSHILTHEYKWAAAEEEARRAIALNPGSAIAHAWLGLVLHVTGRLADAEQATRRAVDLDPLSGQWKSNLALTLYAAGRQDETLTVARSAEQLGGVFADEIAISALLRLRRFDDARQIVERWKAAGKPAHTINLTSSYIFAAEGRRAEAAKLVAETEAALRSRSEQSPELAAELVRAYAGIGNADRVFANLGPEHHATLEYFVYHWQYVPEFRALAGDPRLEAVYRLVGLRR